MAKTTQVRRDPFARSEVHRTTCKALGCSKHECAWCGSPARFHYRDESDDGRRGPWSAGFCSISCLDSYHG